MLLVARQVNAARSLLGWEQNDLASGRPMTRGLGRNFIALLAAGPGYDEHSFQGEKPYEAPDRHR